MTKSYDHDPPHRGRPPVARFYPLPVQPDLLAGWSVVRECGRIGKAGQVRVDVSTDLAKAEAAARLLEASKRWRGYR